MSSLEGPIVICLVGITGEGKSSSGNMLCDNASAFKTSRRMKSVTSVCSFSDFEVGGVSYRVIDTVGSQDTDLNTQELHKRFCQFADLSPNGVDVFLFVAKRGRFRPDHVQAFDAFEEACGYAVLKHTMFLFTCLEEESNSEFMESLASDDMPQTFCKCFKKVGGRAVGVENKLGGKARQMEDRQVVLSSVLAMTELNRRRYDNQQLQDAKRWRAAIKQKAKQLEMPVHQQTVLQLLEDRLHGRCERSDVQDKVAALLKSEARLKAKNVLDAMAVLGQLKETCERLTFEAGQLPDRCGKETKIMMDEFCSGHRDCYESSPHRQGNHPQNCALHPLYTTGNSVAASQCCQSTLVKDRKTQILCESSTLINDANKDGVLHLLQRSPVAVAFQAMAEDMLAGHKRIQATCSLLAQLCPEQLTFHICLGDPGVCKQICGKTLETEVMRITAGNNRVAELTKSMEALAIAARNEAAIQLQAAFRGQVARRLVSLMRKSVSSQDNAIACDCEDDEEEEGVVTVEDFQHQSSQAHKRRSRRGGMNKRLQKVDAVDVASIPATDDGFD